MKITPRKRGFCFPHPPRNYWLHDSTPPHALDSVFAQQVTRMIRTTALKRGHGIAGFRQSPQRALLGALLVLCLLFAQWLGHTHAITHLQGQTALAGQLELEAAADPGSASSLFDHPKASTACAAFDAATLGAGLCSEFASLWVTRAPQVAAPAIVLQRWQPLFTPVFSSRAPPLNA